MRASTLVTRSLSWYWRTNLAVIGGVATAVAVLAGALLVGESVRASLRDLFLGRLGRTDHVLSSTGFFREQLATELGGCPVIVLDGLLTHQTSRRRASGIEVYGVDERFWKFNGLSADRLGARDAMLSSVAATELGVKPGDSILIRVEKHSDIPQESLHGRKEDAARTVRVTVRRVMDPRENFSIRPQQGDVRAVYVALKRLQDDLEQPGKVNTALLTGARNLNEFATIEDLGVRVRVIEPRGQLQVETVSAVVNDGLAEKVGAAAQPLGLRVTPILTYLANAIRTQNGSVPYSLVTAMNLPEPEPGTGLPPILLNDWAARDLGVKMGDPIWLDYYVWKQHGQLETESTEFRLAGVVPIEGGMGDRDLAPEYPGITGSETLDEWDPPFPMDLKKVRPKDEDYWKRYRTTPKAFIPLQTGQRLWGARFGKLTSLRLKPADGNLAAAREAYVKQLRQSLDPLHMGYTVDPVRDQGLAASRGATDFGEYFTYFSFFLVASALMLAGMFFKLGVEQRQREIGLLRAVGYSPGTIRVLFLGEGLVLALIGAIIGAVGAVGYAAVIMHGLRTWWVDAVGTTMLELHISAVALGAGVAGGVLAAIAAIAWTLRGLARIAPRALLHGDALSPGLERQGRPRTMITGTLAAIAGGGLLIASAAGAVGQTEGFFGAGTLLLIAALLFARVWVGRGPVHLREGRGVGQLGLRSAGYRPGRSTLSIALIAFAAFMIVAVEAFRRDPNQAGPGAGGFPLMAESLLPIYSDLNLDFSLSHAGWEIQGAKFTRFRLRPGDDASCLNLYQPRNPRVLGAPLPFLQNARFAFQASIPKSENPWLLLEKPLTDGAIPAAADANSLAYVLHKKLGDEIVVNGVRLRLVAALSDSIFQRELIISEENFIKAFPEEQGWRFFLIDAPPPRMQEAVTGLEDALSDYGLDVVSTADRLASFHRVENTYLSTFQTLGALGLLLGTAGLAAILLRNVLERRREMALLRAVGYQPGHLRTIVLVENLLLLVVGLAAGGLCAALAVAPALIARGTQLPAGSLALMLAAVFVTGLIASIAAATIALRSPLLAALRSE
jgi:putative ABC transport system permease protein